MPRAKAGRRFGADSDSNTLKRESNGEYTDLAAQRLNSSCSRPGGWGGLLAKKEGYYVVLGKLTRV